MSSYAFYGLAFAGLVLWCMALMGVVLWDTRRAPRVVPARPVHTGMTAQGVPVVYGPEYQAYSLAEVRQAARERRYT